MISFYEQDMPAQLLIVSWHNSPPFFLEREPEGEAYSVEGVVASPSFSHFINNVVS
ncbi:MAG: hypothetical protein ACOCWM_04965 [Cyclobacteriaceae bacterium]